MKDNKKNNVFGIVSLVILFILNGLHFFTCFMPLLIEQIKLGSGTNLEMGALILWLFEGFVILGMIFSLVFFVFSITREESKPIIIWNSVLIGLLVIQLILTNVFVFF